MLCEGRNWVAKRILQSCHRVKYIVFSGAADSELYRGLSTVQSRRNLYFQLLSSSYDSTSTRNDKITTGTVTWVA